MQSEKQNADDNIGSQLFPWIWNREMLLAQLVTGHHHESITQYSGKGTRYVPPYWNKHVVEDNCYQRATQRYVGTGKIFVSDFVPDRQVVINAQEDLGKH